MVYFGSTPSTRMRIPRHHQDYYILSREFLTNLSLATGMPVRRDPSWFLLGIYIPSVPWILICMGSRTHCFHSKRKDSSLHGCAFRKPSGSRSGEVVRMIQWLFLSSSRVSKVNSRQSSTQNLKKPNYHLAPVGVTRGGWKLMNIYSTLSLPP